MKNKKSISYFVSMTLLSWGIIMFLFGAVMFLIGAKHSQVSGQGNVLLIIFGIIVTAIGTAWLRKLFVKAE